MDRTTIFENEKGSIYYYPGKKIIHHIMHEYQVGEDLRRFLETGAKLVKENDACKWLSDDRKYQALTKEDMAWGMETFGPKTIKAGWKFWAVIMPESTVGKMAMRRIIEAFESLGVTVQIFTEEDEAMSWLESQ
jgi:hypothetical protein